MSMKPKLDADLSGNPVDQNDYRSKIGSLMYLTSSKPDIVQSEEVYVAQLDGFVDPHHPEKAKYTLEILHKHGIDKGQSIGTPMSMKPKLDADLSGNPVDQNDYRSKIGSLMYLTSSKPDIVQSSAIAISCNPVQYSRTKHFHTRTEYQLVDMFTKALPEDRFKYLVRRIGRLFASFQNDAKYEHGGQETRLQGDKDDQGEKDKDLKNSDEKTKSKDNHKRVKINGHKARRNKPTTLTETKTKA
nr:hypothetical protein [Tanacetum cinerariifolium]